MRSERCVHTRWSAYGCGRGSASGGDAMLTGTMVLKRAMVSTVLALSTSASVGEPVHASVPDPATSCTAEQWAWTGVATLDATTAELDTGVIVPVQIGTELFVVGVSADGLTSTGAARTMTVTIGGTPAVAGGTVPGGRLVVVGDGAPAEVRNATVAINRCAQVTSAAPADAGTKAGPLPHTGSTLELGASVFGALAVAIGTALVVVGRRRAEL